MSDDDIFQQPMGKSTNTRSKSVAGITKFHTLPRGSDYVFLLFSENSGFLENLGFLIVSRKLGFSRKPWFSGENFGFLENQGFLVENLGFPENQSFLQKTKVFLNKEKTLVF